LFNFDAVSAFVDVRCPRTGLPWRIRIPRTVPKVLCRSMFVSITRACSGPHGAPSFFLWLSKARVTRMGTSRLFVVRVHPLRSRLWRAERGPLPYTCCHSFQALPVPAKGVPNLYRVPRSADSASAYFFVHCVRAVRLLWCVSAVLWTSGAGLPDPKVAAGAGRRVAALRLARACALA
jgi:hypothetical protein